ncbi:MAG: hypothetical protein FWD30_00490 [Dehalococcoidia bacterium]|nr:hypothetical protein [Dehalococcoidia bacterium]
MRPHYSRLAQKAEIRGCLMRRHEHAENAACSHMTAAPKPIVSRLTDGLP